jgi:hypothetical protein
MTAVFCAHDRDYCVEYVFMLGPRDAPILVGSTLRLERTSITSGRPLPVDLPHSYFPPSHIRESRYPDPSDSCVQIGPPYDKTALKRNTPILGRKELRQFALYDKMWLGEHAPIGSFQLSTIACACTLLNRTNALSVNNYWSEGHEPIEWSRFFACA